MSDSHDNIRVGRSKFRHLCPKCGEKSVERFFSMLMTHTWFVCNSCGHRAFNEEIEIMVAKVHVPPPDSQFPLSWHERWG